MSVMILATARANNSKTRGINPGQPIFHLETNTETDDIAKQLSLISAMSEWRGEFSTVNLSFNTPLKDDWGTPINENYFDYNTSAGRAIRRASARLLVTNDLLPDYIPIMKHRYT